MKTAAIVLAAGAGKRMNSSTKKQFMMINEKPVLYYSLKAFEESCVDEVVLVVSKGEEQYCKEEYVERFGFRKVIKIVAGGKERYHSVYAGLTALEKVDYVYIHDGARPLINHKMIRYGLEEVMKKNACVFAVPVKDTVKIVNVDQVIEDTPDRSLVWQIQTPQIFSFNLIQEAYSKYMEKEEELVTDDSMIVEKMTTQKVHCIMGNYTNIKITTPEDIGVAEVFLKN